MKKCPIRTTSTKTCRGSQGATVTKWVTTTQFDDCLGADCMMYNAVSKSCGLVDKPVVARTQQQIIGGIL